MLTAHPQDMLRLMRSACAGFSSFSPPGCTRFRIGGLSCELANTDNGMAILPEQWESTIKPGARIILRRCEDHGWDSYHPPGPGPRMISAPSTTSGVSLDGKMTDEEKADF